MLFDTIDHAEDYQSVYPSIYKALCEIKMFASQNFNVGRIEIDGKNLFLLLNSYETRQSEQALMEAHKEYIDIMYMVEGSETVYVKPTNTLHNVTIPYTVESDALLATLDNDASAIHLNAGSFLVLFPQDAHCPGCIGPHGTKSVKKIIGKLRVSEVRKG